MTIKEVERQTGLTRSNIRFYEKENLIEPSRNDSNGYREYSEKDVATIIKIAYLRTLGISVEDIRNLIAEKISLVEILERQNIILQEQIDDWNKAKILCEKMLEAGNLSFDELQVEKYVADLQNYWSNNKIIINLDTVSFLYLWGNLATWTIIVSLCLVTAILSYAELPPEIPVQWSKGVATALVDKKFIFAYPLVCIAIRILLRPILSVKLAAHNIHGELITEYLTNYMCFIALSMEVFSILFVYGLAKSVLAVLIADTVVLIGILIAGMKRCRVLIIQ